MNQGDLDQVSQELKKGSVIAYPTEAVWGLGCDPDNQQAVERILALKERPVEKGLILLSADISQLQPLLRNLPSSQLVQLEASWPGPVTWLIPDPEDLYPPWIKGAHQSVAIRVSAHPLAQAISSSFGKPLVSTSANRAGEPEIRSRIKLQEEFGRSIDLIVAGELGDSSKPSEIRDLMSGQVIR